MLSLFMALAIAAEDPELDCENPQYQSEMNICAGQEYEAADELLNAQWKLTVAAMKERDEDIDRAYDKEPTSAEALLAAQRAWLGYRDQHCLVESFIARGGTMAPMLYSGCLSHLTKLRTAELKALVEEY